MAGMAGVGGLAEGVFAPGHLGELTRFVPFELVDGVLAECRAVGRRVRRVPPRVVVYLLLAAALFPRVGYSGVWRKLVASLPLAVFPSGSALGQARRRLGPGPLKALFAVLRGPGCAGVRWCGLRVCALDGTTVAVPDTAQAAARWGRATGRHGAGGFPLVRVVAVVACQTRAVLDAVCVPISCGEPTAARRLLPSLRAGMIVLADRNFAGNDLAAAIADTGADLLVRLKSNRVLPVTRRCRDGSYLSMLGGLPVRVIVGRVTVTTPAGQRSEVYRLATTLLAEHRYPAEQIMQLYHKRWEIETAFYGLKHTLLGGRVLRARTLPGIEQELYALLCAYQILMTAITHATSTQPGLDPDRASFTIALETARDQIIKADTHTTTSTVEVLGVIGRHVLDNLNPPRRARTSPRAVKRPLSRYAHQSLRINRKTHKTTISIDITPPPDP